MSEKIVVEVAYATPAEQLILTVDAEPGITIEQAINASGVLAKFPEIDLEKNKVGIFGKAGKLEQKMDAGDRVEIYRPLIADPKAARKKKAKKEPAAEAE